MKIGDLVRYNSSLFGLEDCLGIIVASNGEAFDVQWADRHSRKRLPRGGSFNESAAISTELPEFLEIVNASR